MSQIVKLRRSSTGGNRPTNSQLQLGELAINTTDGKLYFAKSGSLGASIEEVLTTNSQNTGSLNLSGSLNVTGTEKLIGDLIVSGNVYISGTTELGGNIFPKEARGATLGTLERPFADIYVSSGSINIAGIVGQPNTTLSNVSGNILISAGGMQLVGSGAFNAQTGSFQFISGSMKQVGDYTQIGSYSLLGDKNITGSLKVSGSVNITGSLNISGLGTGSTTDNIVTYNPTTKVIGSITGLTASQVPTRYYGAFYDTTTQSGTTNVSQAVQLGGTQHTNGVSVVNGSRITVTNAGVYNLQFSTQLFRTGGGNLVTTYFWFRVNGVDVTNSNTAISTNANNGYTVASWNYVDVYDANDYVELIWMSDEENVQLQSVTNPAGTPSIPSVILTLTQV